MSDLHLGKSERIARRGGSLLPPYETTETLDKLSSDIATTNPATVICLGDSFDDLTAGQDLAPEHRDRLITLAAGRRWIWIEGNHDPGPVNIPGEHLAQLRLGALTFRHIAAPGARAEVSGHYHPKARLNLKGRQISSPCFLKDANRLILPAYGAYTGGLSVHNPALSQLMEPGATAILTRAPTASIPIERLTG